MGILGNTGKDLAPDFEIAVNGHTLEHGLSKLVEQITYDSSDGLADMMKISVINAGNVSAKTVFAVGNAVALWAGYNGGGGKQDLGHIGTAIIDKVRVSFPVAGQSMIEVVAYTPDRKMMRNSPAALEEENPFLSEEDQEKKDKKDKKAKKKGGKRYARQWPEDSYFSDPILDRADDYGFELDIDQTNHEIMPNGMFQKASMTDFDFCSGLANDFGYLFWVDGNDDGLTWTLHFLHPDEAHDIQDSKFTFIYNQGNEGSLLGFDGEQLLGNGVTKLTVQIKNPQTNKLESYTVEADPGEPETISYIGVPNEDTIQSGPLPEVIISIGDTAVKVVADRNFHSAGQVKRWAEEWFRKNQDQFFSGSGTVTGPGIEKLKARQVHALEGLDLPWDGDYYFSTVTHTISASNGYSVDFAGRKIV